MTSLFERRLDRRVEGLCWLFFVLVLLRNAWLCEDSYITLRVVDNLVHGYGPRWNPLERVQVYTHPLWMMLVSAVDLVVRDVYFAEMSMAIVCSTVAGWLLLTRVMKSTAQCVLATALVTFSKAFMDYSTSGLENPLSHVLLLLFFIEYSKAPAERVFGRLARWAALAMVTRMDLVWLVLPALAHVTWEGKLWRRGSLRGWLGFWPFAAWEAFSVVYYGFPFPNSAYAKLGVPVPAKELVAQGVYYLANSLAWDPLTLFTIAAMVAVGLVRWRRSGDREAGMLTAGVLLYMAYILRVGGDYMSGRFLTTPLLCSLLLLSRVEFENVGEFAVPLGFVLVMGFAAPRPPILTRDDYVNLGSAPQWVDDERGYRQVDTALLRQGRYVDLSNVGGWVGDGIKARLEHRDVVTYQNIGYFGYFAGPTVHVIDPFGIGDPLMARTPFVLEGHTWAAGHFLRAVPEGYPDAALDRGTIKDARVQAYWKKLELVTRGPLFDPARLAMVVRFNLGLERAP